MSEKLIKTHCAVDLDAKASSIFAVALGDMIAMSGAAVFIESLGHKVIVTALPGLMTSAVSFFVNHPGIDVREANEEQQRFAKDRFAQIGDIPVQTFTQDMFAQMYHNMGIPYLYRWAYSPIREASLSVPQDEVGSDDYTFLHESPSRNFLIDRDKLPPGTYFSPAYDPNKSILAYRKAIEKARQVRCIDSSMFHLADQMDPEGELFLHRSQKPYMPIINDYVTKHQWTIVE